MSFLHEILGGDAVRTTYSGPYSYYVLLLLVVLLLLL